MVFFFFFKCKWYIHSLTTESPLAFMTSNHVLANFVDDLSFKFEQFTYRSSSQISISPEKLSSMFLNASSTLSRVLASISTADAAPPMVLTHLASTAGQPIKRDHIIDCLLIANSNNRFSCGRTKEEMFKKIERYIFCVISFCVYRSFKKVRS
jgi:hypothetical protein